MINPYALSFINLTLCIILGLGLIIYKYIYPKKNINLFFLLIFISLLPLWSIFRPGSYESGDFNIHVYRSIAFYDALKDGQIMPSWPKDLNGTYGYPLFIFNYNFPYYIVSFFHYLSFSFVMSMKLFLGLAYLLSGMFMYLWCKNVFKNTVAAFTASIFYLFTPYHLVDLHFRVSIGEISVFALLPLLLYYIQLFLTNNKKITLLYISLIFSSIILSHAGTGFFSLIIIIPYILYYIYFKKTPNKSIKHHQQIIGLILCFIPSLIISSYVFIPYLLFAKYTYANMLTSSTVSFVKINELLYSPWRIGFLFQGHKGELSLLIGYTQIFVLFSILILAINNFRKKIINNLLIFWLAISFGLIFLISPYSYQIWKTFHYLNVIQFSYRLLLLLTLCISMLAGYYALHLSKKKWFIYLLLTLTITNTILNWGHRNIIPTINDNYLINNLPKSTTEGEGFGGAGSTIWTDIKHPWISEIPQKHLEIINGKAEWKEISRTSVKHEYILVNEAPIVVQENTLYFPGWTVKDNNKMLNIYYSTDRPKGIIEFNLSPGLHYIQVEYKDIAHFWISKLLSIATGIVIVLIVILYNIKFLIRKYL
jgi:hypothetical protein